MAEVRKKVVDDKYNTSSIKKKSKVKKTNTKTKSIKREEKV